MIPDNEFVTQLPDGTPFISDQTIAEKFTPELRHWLDSCNSWKRDTNCCGYRQASD